MQQETIIQFTAEHWQGALLIVDVIALYWSISICFAAGRADRKMEQFEADGLDPAAARQGCTDSLCAPSVPPSGDQKSGGEIISRCRWCENRIGAPSFLVDGYWVDFAPFSPIHYFGDEQKFTDGICPDCFKIEIEKIKAWRIALGKL